MTVATLRDSGPPRPGDDAPDFTAPLLGGGELALADLAGSPVVLNFWASWCGPCEDEAPMLQQSYEEFGGRVHFVGVNIKDALSDAQAFVEQYGMEYPSVRDETGKIYSAYGLTGQPETFFIDASGKLYEHVQGPLFEEDLLLILQGVLTQ
jgi:cytochrome c biogenesis protein CcmG/thiol:disulfide interchange protein DsbE